MLISSYYYHYYVFIKFEIMLFSFSINMVQAVKNVQLVKD